MKDVPNFMKNIPRVPKCVPRWASAPNHILMGSKMKLWIIHVQMGVPKATRWDMPNFTKDVPNFVKDVPDFVKDVPKVSKRILK